MYYVYLVECSDGTYYCGYAKDLNSRISEHNNSKLGAKYTKSRRPVKLVYSERFLTKSEALRRECTIKRLSRKGKEALVAMKDKKAI
jgi:putative endonuclease